MDVIDSASLERADYQIKRVRLDGPILEANPAPDGLAASIPRLVSLVEGRGYVSADLSRKST